MNHLAFLRSALLVNLKLSLALRAVFIFTIVITVIKQILFLMTWNFFFERYKIVVGWDFDSMLLAYGIVCFSIGVVEAFFYGVKELPRLIETGQLDVFLLQPKNVILNIAISRGDLSAFGEIVTGLIVITYSGYLSSAFPQVILLLLLGVLFVFSLLLYLSCLAFFIKDASDFIRTLNLNVVIMASQPNVAYRGALKMLTFTLLPVAFLSFLPVEYLRTGLQEYLGYSVAGTLLFFAIVCWVFHLGLRRYESGSLITFRQ